MPALHGEDPAQFQRTGLAGGAGALVGVVVGGMDRLWSAALGGFVVGLVYGLLSDVMSSTSSVYLPAVVYGLVIVVLLVRPGGLFGAWRALQAERV